jgi:cysteine desulfurase
VAEQLIYLDYNATTPVDPRVLEAMLPYFSDLYGNPANGLHRQGRLAAKAVDEAREQVAQLLGAQSYEIYFTGGATESNNLAIEGLARGTTSGRRRIVTTAVEHKAVLAPCKRLAQQGWDVIVMPVDENGVVDLAAAEMAIDDSTLLVSVQAANNEIGVLQPVRELAALAHSRGALIHTDAAQAVGKIPYSVESEGVDLLSASAHKLYGPKGVGMLYVRGGTRRTPLEPLMLGGGQESGLRSGTTNVPGIVGFGAACEIALHALSAESERIRNLRDQFETKLKSAIPGLRINGVGAARLPNTSSLTFPGVDADALLLNLPTIMLGTGSACSSGAIEPSHVLTAMGLSREAAFATVRGSLGFYSTAEDVAVATALIELVWVSLVASPS